MTTYEKFKSVKSAEEFDALRDEIKELFQREEYGYFPKKPLYIKSEKIKDIFGRDKLPTMAGKAVIEQIKLTLGFENGEFSFPFNWCYRPGQKNKTIVHLNFRNAFPDRCLPAEEIVDGGFNIADFCYTDITSDDNDFENGMAALFDRNSERAAGKIVMWAYAASRIVDYLETREEADMDRLGVAGLSRLGKTAIVTAAYDEHFKFCHSCCSGTSGAAMYALHNEKSEPIEGITSKFPHWFCPNFKKYSGMEKEMPFDQDMLMSLICPRVLSVSSATKDAWANPYGEYTAARNASEISALYGKSPIPKLSDIKDFDVNTVYGKDNTYFIREGIHYMSREDWQLLMKSFDKNLCK